MVKCLITRPNHDKVTSYLFAWSMEIINFPYENQIRFFDLAAEKATKSNFESYIKKQDPEVVLFNGHGDYDKVCGFKDEVIIQKGKNEDLLKGKIVYSLSCSSASELGESAVLKGTKTFIGYQEPFVIYTDSDRETTPLKDGVASSFIRSSNILSISILKGKTVKESSIKSKEEFRRRSHQSFLLRTVHRHKISGSIDI